MAREYARLRTSILADSDWRKLSSNAQNLYYSLLVHPTMTYTGVVDWRPKRFAAMVKDWTVKDVEKAAQELEALTYVVLDDDTEEILVRSFMRNDNVISQPQLAVALVNSYAGIASEKIRLHIIHELKRLEESKAELKGWSKVESLLLEPSQSAFLNPPIQGSGQGAVQGEFEVEQPSDQGVTPLPTPTPSPKEKYIEPSKRKTQAPESMEVTSEMREWAAKNDVTVDLIQETAQFLDHHASKGSLFIDWRKAWQMWMRNSKKYAAPTSTPARTPDGRLNPDAILGRDLWTPPAPPDDLPDHEYKAWLIRVRREHDEARYAEAQKRATA